MKGLNGVNYVAGPTRTEATLGKTHTTQAKIMNVNMSSQSKGPRKPFYLSQFLRPK